MSSPDYLVQLVEALVSDRDCDDAFLQELIDVSPSSIRFMLTQIRDNESAQRRPAALLRFALEALLPPLDELHKKIEDFTASHRDPTSFELIFDPVELLETRQVFDRSLLRPWLDKSNKCPITNVVLHDSRFDSRPDIKRTITRFLEEVISSALFYLPLVIRLSRRFYYNPCLVRDAFPLFLSIFVHEETLSADTLPSLLSRVIHSAFRVSWSISDYRNQTQPGIAHVMEYHDLLYILSHSVDLAVSRSGGKVFRGDIYYTTSAPLTLEEFFAGLTEIRALTVLRYFAEEKIEDGLRVLTDRILRCGLVKFNPSSFSKRDPRTYAIREKQREGPDNTVETYDSLRILSPELAELEALRWVVARRFILFRKDPNRNFRKLEMATLELMNLMEKIGDEIIGELTPVQVASEIRKTVDAVFNDPNFQRRTVRLHIRLAELNERRRARGVRLSNNRITDSLFIAVDNMLRKKQKRPLWEVGKILYRILDVHPNHSKAKRQLTQLGLSLQKPEHPIREEFLAKVSRNVPRPKPRPRPYRPRTPPPPPSVAPSIAPSIAPASSSSPLPLPSVSVVPVPAPVEPDPSSLSSVPSSMVSEEGQEIEIDLELLSEAIAFVDNRDFEGLLRLTTSSEEEGEEKESFLNRVRTDILIDALHRSTQIIDQLRLQRDECLRQFGVLEEKFQSQVLNRLDEIPKIQQRENEKFNLKMRGIREHQLNLRRKHIGIGQRILQLEKMQTSGRATVQFQQLPLVQGSRSGKRVVTMSGFEFLCQCEVYDGDRNNMVRLILEADGGLDSPIPVTLSAGFGDDVRDFRGQLTSGHRIVFDGFSWSVSKVWSFEISVKRLTERGSRE